MQSRCHVIFVRVYILSTSLLNWNGWSGLVVDYRRSCVHNGPWTHRRADSKVNRHTQAHTHAHTNTHRETERQRERNNQRYKSLSSTVQRSRCRDLWPLTTLVRSSRGNYGPPLWSCSPLIEPTAAGGGARCLRRSSDILVRYRGGGAKGFPAFNRSFFHEANVAAR